MLLVIDNYDSFVFNILRYCAELGHDSRIRRNDRITLAEIERLRPSAILISPGPCSPDEAGISLDLIRAFSGRIPILGICLGHQCLGTAFGGRTVAARVPMHGRATPIRHGGDGLFAGLPDPMHVGRYHSLIVEPSAAMAEHLTVTATSPEGEVMALAHRHHPSFGVQFHPESILSEGGHALLGNFLMIAERWNHAHLA
ncbi:glutamine amidotransferase [Aureimonas endophytica]|uniref:Glutamine amidotransferase n=1 Tax=Aureimonas endophytica TaxID=2027858 RepID=A0A916ZC54_9HYPH|nr:aminodeoxychorismate/anthranilate synthase component II [Aureimonas endophytica]GGD87018.1 glutamine amidotransferase [Aureimonas endophytica]